MSLRAVTTVALIAVVLVLSGCQARESTSPAEIDSGDEVTSAEVEEIENTPAVFYPEGSAAQNEPYFRQVLSDAKVGSTRVSGEDVREALTEAGFPEDSIEATPDNSGLALPADSVAIAVAIDDSCLIGQWGKDWLATQVVPLLETGKCFIGEMESLD